MTSHFKLHIKANDRVFINGAVIRFDRKVGLELLNDVDFLLEQHVLQIEDATTPLKQLYYIVQMALMAPNDADNALRVARSSVQSLLTAFENPKVLAELKTIDAHLSDRKVFDVLKSLRRLFPVEERIFAGDEPDLAHADAGTAHKQGAAL